jgi:hypothetical protein
MTLRVKVRLRAGKSVCASDHVYQYDRTEPRAGAGGEGNGAAGGVRLARREARCAGARAFIKHIERMINTHLTPTHPYKHTAVVW